MKIQLKSITVLMLAFAFAFTACSRSGTGSRLEIYSAYTVTFDSQGGSAVTSQMVYEGAEATQPTDPTMTNYTFAGWFKEATCTTAWAFNM